MAKSSPSPGGSRFSPPFLHLTIKLDGEMHHTAEQRVQIVKCSYGVHFQLVQQVSNQQTMLGSGAPTFISRQLGTWNFHAPSKGLSVFWEDLVTLSDGLLTSHARPGDYSTVLLNPAAEKHYVVLVPVLKSSSWNQIERGER